MLARVDTQGVTLLAHLNHEAIRQGTATNRIALSCRGNTLAAYVNGERVAVAEDDTLQDGQWIIGTATLPGVAGVVDTRFDNLTLSTPS